MAAAKKTKLPVRRAAKTTAPKTPKNRWTKVQLPAGYTAITQGDFGEEWDYENNPVLEGTVEGEVREVEAGKGREKRVVRMVNVKTDHGTFALWESASLRAFFDKLYDGAAVAVAFQGYRDVGRPQPMKNFVGAIWEDEGLGAATASRSTRSRQGSRPTRSARA